MIMKDPFLERMIKDKTPILINDMWFTIEKNPFGSCDGCYFLNKDCPAKAVTLCCSNGGNILKKYGK